MVFINNFVKLRGDSLQNFISFLDELSEKANIYFSITSENDELIFENKYLDKNEEKVKIPIYLSNNNAFITVGEKDRNSIELLKYVVEEKYKEFHTIKEQLLLKILKGNEVPEESIIRNIPCIYSGSNMLVIEIPNKRVEALNKIKESFKGDKIIGVIYDSLIILIRSKLDRFKIKDILMDMELSDIVISYDDSIRSQDNIKEAFERGKECLQLKKVFHIKEDFLDYNKLLFEKIVYNIKEDIKNELMDKFFDKFNSFDYELLSTIEEFINCGLNISEAAKVLFVHRNTLIYRLDKIKKETGFDIRNFKEATLFIISYLIWKEKGSY